MTVERETERGMTVLKIIWIAMLASLAAYLVIGRLAAPNVPSSVNAKTFASLRMALYAIGLVTLIAAGYVRRLMLGGINRFDGSTPAPRSAAIQKYTSAVIISLALCESVGIYGLVLFLLGKHTLDLYLLLGISAAAMIYYRPNKEEMSPIP